jgi:hypothetical protein
MLQHLIHVHVLAVILLTGVLIKPASAETLIVDDFVYVGSEVLDDVLVVQGGILFLDGTTVLGNIKVAEGGALVASTATVNGNVKSDRALLIELGNCDIQGNVDLKRTGGEGTVFGILPLIIVFANDVCGNVKISQSDVNSFTVRDNLICGRLQLTNNKAVFPIVVENNVVGNCDN